MSFGAFDDAKEQVRQAIDIVELIGSYLDLRSQGRDFVAHCPWHDDARPSLRVSRERQTWKCWVCDIGGDAFSFVMRREGVGFREALEMLADRAGIELRRPTVTASAAGSANDKRTLFRAAAWAEQLFHQCLLHAAEAEPARQYLAGRGIAAESIARYGLGYAPPQWQWLVDRARTSEFSLDVLEAIGLVATSERSRRPYDRFRGRVIFPIRDPQRRTIAFGGRILPGGEDADAAKYINSPETRLFSKSEQLYGLDVVRDEVTRQRHVLVMEGYTDVIMAVQQGISNAVAVLGTALGPRHLRLLRRYVDRVTLVLDGDDAGKRRANEVLKLFLAADLDLRILTLPDDLDPCEFLQAHGADRFHALVSESPDALEHKVRQELTGFDPLRDTHRAHQAVEEILQTMALVPETQVQTAVRIREQQLLARLGREFGVAEPVLRSRLEELRAQRKVPLLSEPPSMTSLTVRDLHPRDAEWLEILLVKPALLARAADVFPSDQLETEPARRLYEAMLQELEQGAFDFGRLLAQIEDPDLKSVLVALDEQAQAKHIRTEMSADERFLNMLALYDRQALERERQELRVALQRQTESTSEDEAQTLRALLELTRQVKSE